MEKSKVFLWLVLLCIGAALAPATVRAQSSSASLNGKVVDASGAVLPGVTVTAKSPALQVGQQTAVTGADGTYQILNLPVGDYTIKFELQGFQAFIRTGVHLTVGLAGRIDAELKVGSVSESVTVSGESPVVDTVNTTSSTTFTKDVLDSTPTGRGMWQVYGLASGISTSGTPDVGDSQIGSRGDIQVYGVAQQATINVEGINAVTFDGPGFSSAQYIDGFMMNQIKVTASGANPEFGTPGAAVQVEMKSGANDYHGAYQGAFETPRMQSNNITPALKAQGLHVTVPLDHYYDWAGDLGGHLIKDKLWFYGGVTRQSEGIGVAGFAQSPGPDGVYLTPDDVPGTQTFTMHDYFGKVSAQPWRSTNFNGSYIDWAKDAMGWHASRLRPAEAADHEVLPGKVWRGEMQSVPNSSILLDAYLGFSGYNVTYGPMLPSAYVAGNPSREELSTKLYTGPDSRYPGKYVKNYESHETLTYLPKGRFLGGKHELKTGFIFTIEGGGSSYDNEVSGDYLLRFLNGAPNSITMYNSPVSPINDMRNQALFATDTWTMNRFTFNLGVRWERYHAWYPDQSRAAGAFSIYPAASFPGQSVLLWKRVVPRLGMDWDMFGNGKTVFKATFGEYSNQPGYNFAENYNPNASASSIYRWHDLNGNRNYDPGEVNLDPNGPDFISASGGVSQLVNPNLIQPHEYEAMAELDHELMANTAVSFTWVRKQMINDFDEAQCPEGYDCSSTRNVARPASLYTVAVPVIDPGPDGKLGTADDGGAMTLYTYPAQYAGAAFNQTMFVNAPSNRPDIYNTFEGSFTKRYSNHWNMLASFGITKNNAWMPLAAVPQTPNDELFPRDETWNWHGHMTASYSLPWQVDVSGTLQADSGQHYARTVTFGNIPELNTATVRVEPFGTEQLPTFSTVSLRLSKGLSLGGSRRASIIFDAFNLFNNSAQTAGAFLSGSAYGFATDLLPPRVLRLGAKFSF
ncbi:MAG TPA: carboxypeptidase regulatory-like domain-containing protein [Vicinamibacterales bacterium]|jgi:hypothetical protein